MSKARYIADFIVSSNDIANSTITYVDIGTVFTSNIFENGDTTSGNLYFTNARVDARISTTSINALFDVDVTGVSTNQTLIWDGTKWAPGSPIVGSTGFSENANVANIALSLSNLTTSNLNEGTNLYFTNARVFANVSGLLSAKVNTADLTTNNVRELSNLYFTNARVDARFLTTSINVLADVDITGITTNQVLVWDGSKFAPTTIATSSFANVSNLANLVSSLENFTTSNLSEGSNLYYTNTRVYSNVLNILQFYNGNIRAGNVIVTGKFVGDGSGITGLNSSALSSMATYGGNILAANITATSVTATNVYANSFISTGSGIPTLQSGTSINLTANNAVVITNSVLRIRSYSDTDRNTNIIPQTGDVIFNTTSNVLQYYSNGQWISSGNATALIAGLTTSNINEGSNLYFTNARVLTAVTTGNISNLTITGNIVAGNLNISGFLTGNGAFLTGITGTSGGSANLAGIATYNGNILASNITAFTISTSNITVGNIIGISGGSIVAGAQANTVILGGLYRSTFDDVGNVTVPNLVAQGRIFGDGSGITGLSLASFNIATYTGNISAANVTVTQFVVTPTIYLGSNSQANNRITATTSDNTTIRHGLYTTQFLVGGNVVTTGKFVGDGSGLSGVVGSSNLTTLPVYTGNILASNITVTSFLVTPNLILGNSSVSNSRITFTNSDNTAIRHGIYTTQFLTNGNVVSTGKFVGDGSGLTGITTSLTGMATYGGNILAANVTATNLNTTNLYVSNIINSTGTTILSVTVSNNTSIRAGAYTSQFLDTGNVLLPNVVVSGKFYGDGSGITGITASLAGLATYGGNILAANITANSISAGAILSSAGNISSIPGQNTIIFGGLYASTFSDTGNVTFPNVIIQGRISGNGSGLTGISLASLNLPAYGGNILATNITTTFLTTNTLIASFGNITALGGANTVIFGGSYASTFADTGNVTVPNIVVQGKIFGDGSGITGISLASLNLATYAGNVLGRNVTASEFILTPNLIIGNNSASNSRITFNTSDNTSVRHGIYVTQFLTNGNISTTGRFVGDGSGLSNISSAGLNLPTYAGNILVANLFASQFIVTPNLILGNTSVSNSRITFNTSDNTTVRHGIYTTQFLTNGNLVTTGKFVGDGSGLTGVLTSIGSIATYGGNILSNNVTANIVYTNSLVGRTGNANISLLAGDNTVIFGGVYSSRFDDTGNVTLPNVIVSGRASGLWVGNVNSANVVATSITASVISFGTSANLSSRNDNNTIISTGSYNTTFRDSGTIETTNVWVSTGLYVGSQALNNIISTSSRGSGTTTTYIGNQSITTSSDLRLKNILGNTTVDAVNVVSNLRVVDFTWIDPSDTSFNNKNVRGTWTGLIAQEVINNVPYVVNAVRDEVTLLPIPNSKNEQGKDIYWGMEYDKLVPLLIKAVQEQQKMIDNLNARIIALESNK